MPGLKKKKRLLRGPRKILARVMVRPPTRPSSGAQTVARELGTTAKISRRSPVLRQYRHVINWGNSSPLVAPQAVIFNPPAAVALASHKLHTFQRLAEAGVRIPEFFTEPPTPTKKSDIFLARTILNGSSGEGITVVRNGEAMPRAPLYVKYVRKEVEYRVHVAFGEVIFVQQKKRKSENEQTADEKLIRNHDNGWVFCPVETGSVVPDVLTAAIGSCAALGLHFGAVDCIIGRTDELPYVLEINTAPGIKSPGLTAAYRTAFQKAISDG